LAIKEILGLFFFESNHCRFYTVARPVRKKGEVVHFSAQPKNEPYSPFFASEASTNDPYKIKTTMLTVQEAENIIFSHKIPVNTEGVPLEKSIGRILQEDLYADRDFPPFDRVTMDGIAIRFQDFQQGHRIFKIEGVQAAGSEQLTMDNGQSAISCFEVMTGAMLPIGCDTVIRYENLKIENGFAEIMIENVVFQQNLHFRGIDRKQNDAIILRGGKISAAEIATAATIGKMHLQVAKLPKIAIVSTGDELVDIGGMPLPYQIRRSNVYAIKAMLETEFKIKAKLFHFNDDKTLIFKGLKKILKDYDIVILSGAVSEGKFDFVPMALADLGVEKLFHKVAQRPGKPFWFGVKTVANGFATTVFALPGNPVSTFLCAYRYVVPFIEKSLGMTMSSKNYAVLSEKVVFKADLTYFLPVKLQNTEGGVLMANPLAGHGSGDLANLNDTDGFLELPQKRDIFEAGEAFPFLRYRI
jgi:molybdopterin molybdotransferase